VGESVALLNASVDYYLFDGKYHRLYRRLISLLSAYESALAELWHFRQSASAERADFVTFLDCIGLLHTNHTKHLALHLSSTRKTVTWWWQMFSTSAVRYGLLVTLVASLRKSLESIQGIFLRAITGAYKAASIGALEIETFIEPLDLYLEKSASQGAARQVLRGYGREGRIFREILRNRYRRRGPLRHEPNSISTLKVSENVRPEIIENPTPKDARLADEERTTLSNAIWKEYKKALEAFYASKWKDRWEKSKKGRAIALYHS